MDGRTTGLGEINKRLGTVQHDEGSLGGYEVVVEGRLRLRRGVISKRTRQSARMHAMKRRARHCQLLTEFTFNCVLHVSDSVLLDEQARVFGAFRGAYDRRPRLERRFAWEGSSVFLRLFRRMTGSVCADKVGGSAGDKVGLKLEHCPPTLAAHQLISALLRGACAETAASRWYDVLYPQSA